jgi:beta-phosphoglucomutase-like phosphatase (HAD superfamily)
VTLALPPGEFRAYLFDCDGTIADNMPLHYRAWRQALGEWGCDLPEDLFYAWGGRSVADIVVDLNAAQGLAMPVAAVERRHADLYQALMPELTAVPEVVWHIEDGHGRVPMAVVSGGAREPVSHSLRTLGLLDRFDVLVCAGEYSRGKPDPECFLLAAAHLDVAPEHCLVFEDTDLGMQAAAAAGMAAVRVPPPWQR